MKIGAIEAGGTKFVCGVGDEHGNVLDSIQFPTETPEITMANVIRYFSRQDVVAIGIGSFGPIGLDKGSLRYGYITTTPKPGWANVDVVGTLRSAIDVPVGWDTDVNAAAIGEARWGAARSVSSCVYYTIGTGVGMGIYIEGQLVHGLVHPEAGHVLVRRHHEDRFSGCCPYHGDCLEGMASGPALEQRWMMAGEELPIDHPAWPIEAFYIAQAVVNTILTVSPMKVILGGGVMQRQQLYSLIRAEVKRLLNGYVHARAILEDIDEYIVPPGLGHRSGLVGALALGIEAMSHDG